MMRRAAPTQASARITASCCLAPSATAPAMSSRRTLRDVIDRAVALEMAYNPNDCVELRWGAPAKSDEAATCKRYAPAAQREKMSKYRAWFHERRRPPRA